MTDTPTPPTMTPEQRAELATLRINEKWSVEYDPLNNDSPKRLLRCGEVNAFGPDLWTNDRVAMFYALLEDRVTIATITADRDGLITLAEDLSGELFAVNKERDTAQAEIARLTEALATAREDGMREGAEALRKTWWRGELTSEDFDAVEKGAAT